uniref:Uncharacterized protein n=1 Tax=Anopheles arabiensis TaxID=7173 RepID=A0A182HNU2_ANOAR
MYDGACTAQAGQERLQLKVVKCEENATITTPVALAREGFACDNGAPKEEKEQEEEEEEENVEDGDQMDITLHRLGADEGILVPSASLFEDGHFGMAFTTAAGGSGAAHHYHHQPPSSLNDDLALMVGRPDDRGFFHCPADSCDRKYKIKYSLLRHLRNECNADRRYSCPKCKKKFSYAFILNRHLLNVHKESPDCIDMLEPKVVIMDDGLTRYVCPQCGVKYKKLSALRGHMKECGKGAQCPLCPKIVTQRRNLAKHMERHRRDGLLEFHHFIDNFPSNINLII